MKSSHIGIGIALALAASSTHAASFTFNHYWSYTHTLNTPSRGSEIAAYDAATDKIWVIGGTGVDILDPTAKSLSSSIELSSVGTPNSVAISNGKAAVALAAPVKTDAGSVRFYDTTSQSLLNSVTVGALPDSVFFTPDGSRALVANEGEPNSYNQIDSVDPVGSVSIIDTSNYSVQTASFSNYNSQEASLRSQGIRIYGPNASAAQDLEPEYIAIDETGSKAYVTLQENNAVAIVDIPSATVNSIIPLGLKNHNLPGNGLDASDQDGPGTTPLNGNIQNWPVFGMYQPDGIAHFESNGQHYIVMANEGDARAYTGLNEEIRVGNSAYVLDPTVLSDPDQKTNNDKLSRLTVTNATGDTDGDGDFDQIHVFGARSFTIRDTDGGIVFDSGDQIEQIIKNQYPLLWQDLRSDNKGPEPEGLTMLKLLDRQLLFLGLERTSSVMVWDITLPASPQFLTMLSHAGDLGPEGLTTFTNTQGTFLVVSNEADTSNNLAGVTTLYQIQGIPEPATLALFGLALPMLFKISSKKRN